MEGISLIFKVLWSPGEAMSRAAKSRRFLAPLVLLTLFSVGVTVIRFQYINDAEIGIRMLEQRGTQLTPEQKSRIMEQANGTFSHAIAVIASVIGPAFLVFLITLLYFGLFTLVGRDGGFKAFYTVTAFACVPLVVRLIVSAIMVIAIPQSSLAIDEIGSVSPAIFLDRTALSKPLFALINSIDVVSLWILVLMVIGYGFVVSRSVSTTVRAICVFSIWLVWVGLRVAISPFFPF